MIAILLILLVVVAFVHYLLCYVISIRENHNMKNADIDTIKNEILNKSKMPAIISIKNKIFWLFMAYIVITTYIAISILDIINNYLNIYSSVIVEIVSIIMCSLICFTIPSILSLRLFMLVIKRKHSKSI